MTTGTSVLAIKYKEGVVIAADTLVSYGSLARYREVPRLTQIGESSILGATGDFADFQYLQNVLEEQSTRDFCIDDGISLDTEQTYSYLSRVMYHRRSEFKPLRNMLVLAGYDQSKSEPRFLGYVDYQGTCYTDNHICTGFGSHIALPLLRNGYKEDLSLEEATKLIEECMKIMFFRDARASKQIQVGVINSEGTKISEPYHLSTEGQWHIGEAAVADPNSC